MVDLRERIALDEQFTVEERNIILNALSDRQGPLFTREELLQLRHALKIACEDGSIYGGASQEEDADLAGALNDIEHKLNAALRMEKES